MSEARATMTEGEFAKAVGLCRVTIWRLRQKGLVPHYKIGRRILFRKEHIEQFLKTYEKNGVDKSENK